MARSGALWAGLLAVVSTMVLLFVVPPAYFAPATFVSTGSMLAVSYYLGGLKKPAGIRPGAVLLGAAMAGALYLVFYAGGAAVDAFHPLGLTSASEASIYSLVASPYNPLAVQVLLLLFDSAGYESFFRGVLQRRLQGRMGAGAAPAVALFDACVHIASLNPVWIVGTFVTDLFWGLTYYYGRGTQASFTSHFLWDVAIFIVRPVT